MKKVKVLFAFTQKEIMEKMGQFQFQESDLSNILKVNHEFRRNVSCEAFYEKKAEHCDSYYVYVTLGSVIDDLFEQYMAKEKIYEAYIMECLSMVYLSAAYDKIFQAIEVQEKKSIQDFYYWEEKNSMDELMIHMESKKITGITFDGKGVMKPSKSVVMIVNLSDENKQGIENSKEYEKNKCLVCSHKCERGKRLCELRSQYLQGL